MRGDAASGRFQGDANGQIALVAIPVPHRIGEKLLDDENQTQRVVTTGAVAIAEASCECSRVGMPQLR